MRDRLKACTCPGRRSLLALLSPEWAGMGTLVLEYPLRVLSQVAPGWRWPRAPEPLFPDLLGTEDEPVCPGGHGLPCGPGPGREVRAALPALPLPPPPPLAWGRQELRSSPFLGMPGWGGFCSSRGEPSLASSLFLTLGSPSRPLPAPQHQPGPSGCHCPPGCPRRRWPSGRSWTSSSSCAKTCGWPCSKSRWTASAPITRCVACARGPASRLQAETETKGTQEESPPEGGCSGPPSLGWGWGGYTKLIARARFPDWQHGPSPGLCPVL